MSINVKHDSRSELYRMPGGAMPAGGSVRIRFWASRPFKQIYLRVWTDAEQRIPMRALGVYESGILYEAELTLPGTPGLCWYSFLLKDSGRDYWYGNAYDHLGGVGEVYDEQPPSYQITVFDPAYSTPDWLRDGVIYQIFPDRFCRADAGICGRLDMPEEPVKAKHAPRAAARGTLARHDAAANVANAADVSELLSVHAKYPDSTMKSDGNVFLNRKSGQEVTPVAAPVVEHDVSAVNSGDPNLRVKPVFHSNWYEKPVLDIAANGDNAARDFFGGNLQGIIAKLDYLALLGVTIIYMNPIFFSPSNHRYNCSDYMKVDPHLGTEDDLKQLCAEGKKRGIRIMLDGVFSHTGDDSVYFNRYQTFKDKGACQGEESPYYSWYNFKRFPYEYQCWWGFDTLPEVNEDSPSFRRFILGREIADGVADESESGFWPEGVVRHYLRAGVSGWRLDVADELPMDFLQGIRRSARAEKSDAAILGEVWEDASNKEAYGQVRCYFKGDTLDSVMNYPLRDMSIDFMLGRINATEFARRYLSLAENYPKPALYSLMNLLGSHDRPRILNLMAGMDAGMAREEQVIAEIPEYARGLAQRRLTAVWRMICALPGVPGIYYGDEAGMQGMNDPFNRGTYPWGHENDRLRGEFATALKVRRQSEVLRRGDVSIYAPNDDVAVIVRRLHDGTDYAGVPSHEQAFMAIINRSLASLRICLDADMVSGVPGLRREGDMFVLELPAITTGYFG